MISNYFWVMFAFSIVMLLCSIIKFRRRPQKMLMWISFWGLSAIIFILPHQVSALMKQLGFFTMPFNAIVVVCFGLIFYLLWDTYSKFESVKRDFKKLIQEIALKEGS